jgi:hypothetical protein
MQPDASHTDRLSLFVVVPSLNEEVAIEEVVPRIPRKSHCIASIRVVIIDGVSDDAARRKSKSKQREAHGNPTNRGEGSTIQVLYVILHTYRDLQRGSA